MLPAKWWPFCLNLTVLRSLYSMYVMYISTYVYVNDHVNINMKTTTTMTTNQYNPFTTQMLLLV